MARISKCYSLNNKAIAVIEKVKKEHEFESASEALEYILLYQPSEDKIKELVNETFLKLISENNISFKNTEKSKENIKLSIDEEVNKVLMNAQDNIFDTMPD